MKNTLFKISTFLSSFDLKLSKIARYFCFFSKSLGSTTFSSTTVGISSTFSGSFSSSSNKSSSWFCSFCGSSCFGSSSISPLDSTFGCSSSFTGNSSCFSSSCFCSSIIGSFCLGSSIAAILLK